MGTSQSSQANAQKHDSATVSKKSGGFAKGLRGRKASSTYREAPHGLVGSLVSEPSAFADVNFEEEESTEYLVEGQERQRMDVVEEDDDDAMLDDTASVTSYESDEEEEDGKLDHGRSCCLFFS